MVEIMTAKLLIIPGLNKIYFVVPRKRATFAFQLKNKKTDSTMEIEGKIIRDLPLQEGVSRAGNPWKKKEWVLETFGQYPRGFRSDDAAHRAWKQHFI